MNFSRIGGALIALACSFAANEVEAATPHVKEAVDKLDDALRSSDPIGAFVDVAWEAYQSIKADPNMVPSLTGLLGAVAQAAKAGFTKGE